MKKKIQILFLVIFTCFNGLLAQIPGYVPTNNLLAWYPFDNNSNDLSGNNNNAVNNNVTFIDDRNGIPNAAGSFNGTNTWLEVATPSFTFASTDSFSYSFWINKDVQPAAGIILMVASGVSDNFISLIQGQNLIQFGTNKQQSPWIWTSCAHTLNVWDHYVATYNAGIMNLYKNGIFESTNTFTYTNVLTSNLPLYIGKGITGGFFNGAIDDIGIWGRALSTQEINDLYNSTVTLQSEITQTPKFKLSSNVASDYILLNSTSSYEKSLSFNIIDINGKIVHQGSISGSSHKINIENFSQGLYLVNLLDESNTKLKFYKLK